MAKTLVPERVDLQQKLNVKSNEVCNRIGFIKYFMFVI